MARAPIKTGSLQKSFLPPCARIRVEYAGGCFTYIVTIAFNWLAKVLSTIADEISRYISLETIFLSRLKFTIVSMCIAQVSSASQREIF